MILISVKLVCDHWSDCRATAEASIEISFADVGDVSLIRSRRYYEFPVGWETDQDGDHYCPFHKKV